MKTVWKSGIALLLAGFASVAMAQSNNTNALPNSPADNSLENSYLGSIHPLALSPTPMAVSFKDALQMGIAHNLGLALAKTNTIKAQSQRLRAINDLAPNLSLHAENGVHEYDLAAQGFSPSVMRKLLPPSYAGPAFPMLARVDLTTAQANYSQQLFNWAGWDAVKAADADVAANKHQELSSLGLVILNVGDLYLRALAAGTQVDMAKSLLVSEAKTLSQSQDRLQAGTTAQLDVLRARVAYEQQQQRLIVSENNFAKAKIALNRAIGLAPGQEVELSSAAPFANLAVLPIDEAQQEAYQKREVIQVLAAEIRAARLERKVASYERLPTLSFSGNWGVEGVAGGIYHGTYTAVGTLSIPIFDEAKFRGDRDVAEAQLNELNQQMNDLKQQVDQQLRDSMLDIATASQLVKVTRSNLALANQTLSDTTTRYVAGVDTNLPVIEAQASVAEAQSRYISSVLSYNEAKLSYARNLGVLDQILPPSDLASLKTKASPNSTDDKTAGEMAMAQ